MTDDKSREAFQRWFSDEYPHVIHSLNGSDFRIRSAAMDFREAARGGWQAALRYRDEQEKGDGKG